MNTKTTIYWKIRKSSCVLLLYIVHMWYPTFSPIHRTTSRLSCLGKSLGAFNLDTKVGSICYTHAFVFRWLCSCTSDQCCFPTLLSPETKECYDQSCFLTLFSPDTKECYELCYDFVLEIFPFVGPSSAMRTKSMPVILSLFAIIK